jgi:hypothetical protein
MLTFHSGLSPGIATSSREYNLGGADGVSSAASCAHEAVIFNR